MHPIFHSFKRMYWSSMRSARDWADEYGITPARLDVLIILAQRGGGVSQSEIHLTLDVCPAVIARMLDSMEERGLVVREDHRTDGRRYWVTLTPRSRNLLHFAVTELLFDGFTERCLWMLVAPDAARHRDVARAMHRVREYCIRQRRYLRDASTMVYPAYLANGERSSEHAVNPRADAIRRARRAARGRAATSTAATKEREACPLVTP